METPISVANTRFAGFLEPSVNGGLVLTPRLVVESGGIKLKGPPSPAYRHPIDAHLGS